MARNEAASTAGATPQCSNSARMDELYERVVREIQTRMSLVTDDENWMPPTQAALECGLHYYYMQHALNCGELTVAIQPVNTSNKGKLKLAVVSKAQVEDWVEQAEMEAEEAGRTLAEQLSFRYNMDRVYACNGSTPDLPEGCPVDLISRDVAKQLIEGCEIQIEQFDQAIERGVVAIYNVGGEEMVSEADVAVMMSSLSFGDEETVEVEDLGECDAMDAAERMGLDPAVLLAAIEANQCLARANGEKWIVRLHDVVAWYDGHYTPAEGETRARYVLVTMRDDIRTKNHYDLDIEIRLVVPNVSAVLNNLSRVVAENAIEKGLVFPNGTTPVAKGKDIADVEVHLTLTVGILASLAFLADQSGFNLCDYMCKMAESNTV